MKKFLAMIQKYRCFAEYLLFGALTTLVNYAVFLPLCNHTNLSAAFSNVIAWVVSVTFAYVTNKRYVFCSRDWSREAVAPELVKFLGCRAGSGLLETVCIFALVDCLGFSGFVVKILTSGAVIAINYLGSKLVVFRRKKHGTADSV